MVEHFPTAPDQIMHIEDMNMIIDKLPTAFNIIGVINSTQTQPKEIIFGEIYRMRNKLNLYLEILNKVEFEVIKKSIGEPTISTIKLEHKNIIIEIKKKFRK
jgi:hypothetical protein